MEGIATAEMLIAIANGEDAEAAAQRISSEIESMFGGTVAEEAARGVYLKSIPLWTDGTVTYRWGSMRDSFKTATRNAMDRWQSATGGKVRFNKFSESGWDWFLLIIGSLHIVRIEEKSLGANTTGQALPGSFAWGISYLYLDPVKCEQNAVLTVKAGRNTAYTVALHELGHVLGLQHEHERTDRDTYLNISGFKLTEWLFLASTRLVWRSTRVWFITIWYPVWVSWTDTVSSCVKTSWDWNSIMLYDGKQIRPAYANSTNGILKNGVYVTRYNTDLSAKDIEIIKTLY
jgi:hypothetical protein